MRKTHLRFMSEVSWGLAPRIGCQLCKPNAINLPYGDVFYQPFMAILGMVNSWLYHIINHYHTLSIQGHVQPSYTLNPS
jgi:hypothetical protein